MHVDKFDFELPDELIALRPAVPRDSARLLVVYSDGSFEHSRIVDLPTYLRRGDVLVANDTRVIPARLRGRRVGRGASEPKIEIMLHRRVAADRFLTFARPARKLELGDRVLFGNILGATIVARGEDGEAELRFDCSGAELDAAVAMLGEMPLPPYIVGKRKADLQDATDYQTMFALHDGSVAAPTAGLHFTRELIARLDAGGIGFANVTLHVGAGTFLPVKADDTKDHHMHPERAIIDDHAAARINQVHMRGGRIVAIGTTSLRTLESAATPDGVVHPYDGETDIFITPGYRFRTAEFLLTNFHLPRSTLFMLVSAFSGREVMKAAYDEAIRQRYRFYSYGDACLLFRGLQ